MSIPLHDLTFSVRYMEVVEGLLLERGAPLSVLLQALALSEAQLRDPQQTINGVQYQKALMAALPHCLPGTAPSTQFLAHVPLTIVGPLGMLAMASDTLGDALSAVDTYAQTLFPAYAVRKHIVKDEVHMVLTRLSDFGEADDLLTEIVVGMFLRFERFMAAPLTGVEVHLRHPAGTPPYSDPAIQGVRHDAPVDKVIIPKRLMGIPLLTKSRVMQAEVTQALAAMAKRDPQAHPFTQQSKRIVQNLLVSGKALHGDAVAEAMKLSRRTLNRRLEEEGATLAQVIEEVRMSLAETLLLSTQMPINEIARRVGFTEAQNFSRAFKRARGLTPRARRDTRQ